MSTNNYQLFKDSALQLAQTMVIKSAEAALSINQGVIDSLGEDAVDILAPETWRYYMHLSGEYHPADTPMMVVSLDNLQTIEFSKENLLVHRATARGYAFGTRQYKELVSKYPNQRNLIRGILYPADIHKAINADNWTILSYAPGLVEENEYSLIAKLQKWIYDYRDRWVNDQFGLVEDQYYTTMIGVFHAFLQGIILSFRLDAVRTNEVHSFFVRQYLASHNGLDAYMDQMTLKQSLWLYRNIVYIEANFGKQETFDWLLEHIMTQRSLPLGKYTMRHDVSNQPTEIYPEITFEKTALNEGLNSDFRTTFDVPSMLNKLDTLARSNPAEKVVQAPMITRMMKNSRSSVVATKTLESSVVDRSNNTPWTLNDILLHHWLFFASEDIYTAFVSINDPITGEHIPLSVKDAYAFLWYSFAKSIGIELVEVPQVIATRVQRVPTPSVDDLMSVVDKTIIARSVAESALSLQPRIDPIISTEAFYNKCTEIYSAAQMQRRLIANTEHATARGMTYGLVSRIYSDNLCRVADEGEKYVTWFADRNIAIDNYTVSDLSLLYIDIVKNATGMALNTKKSLKDLQASMVNIMKTLTSYSVQYNTEINSSDIMVTDWTSVRVDKFDGKLSDYVDHNGGVAEVKATHGKMKDRIDVDVNKFVHTPVTSRLKADIDYDLGSPFPSGSGKFVAHWRMEVGVRATPVPVLRRNARNIIPVMGLAQFLMLPMEDQVNMVDAWGSQVGIEPGIVIPPTDLIPLAEGIPNNVLNGLVYDNTYPPARNDLDKLIARRQLDGFDHT